MSSSSSGSTPRSPQGGGELSGLLRHAEALQRDLDKALVDLKSEEIEAHDAARLVSMSVTGDGSAKEVRLHVPSIPEADRKKIEDALLVALRLTLERLFELRRRRANAVTKGLALPGLYT